ncbi:MAG: Asp-tRNA(Asn)/Glu-tRNA(Gln) amidotransferase subunit GatC [Bacteroidota bacterium]
MSVTKKDVRYVAELAHLQLSEKEIPDFVRDMNQILDYMELLNELDTSTIEPLNHVIEQHKALRPDLAEQPLSHVDALKNAPDAGTRK